MCISSVYKNVFLADDGTIENNQSHSDKLIYLELCTFLEYQTYTVFT